MKAILAAFSPNSAWRRICENPELRATVVFSLITALAALCMANVSLASKADRLRLCDRLVQDVCIVRPPDVEIGCVKNCVEWAE
jgi:hypothetical protein